MKNNNILFRIGQILLIAYLFTIAPFIRRAISLPDFIQGLLAGCSIGFMILGLLSKNKILTNVKAKKSCLFNIIK